MPAGCLHLITDPVLGHLTCHQAALWHGHPLHLLGNPSIHPSSPLLKGKNLFWTEILYCQYAWGSGQPLSHRDGLYKGKCWNFVQGTGWPLLDCCWIIGRKTSKCEDERRCCSMEAAVELRSSGSFFQRVVLDGVSRVQREDGKVPGGEALWLLNDKVPLQRTNYCISIFHYLVFRAGGFGATLLPSCVDPWQQEVLFWWSVWIGVPYWWLKPVHMGTVNSIKSKLTLFDWLFFLNIK